jgi:hypothetical protein
MFALVLFFLHVNGCICVITISHSYLHFLQAQDGIYDLEVSNDEGVGSIVVRLIVYFFDISFYNTLPVLLSIWYGALLT